MENRVAIVTGGSSGIGAATADLLAERGAQVAVVDLSRPASSDHYWQQCDVSSAEEVGRAVSAVADQFQGIDMLVNNAGVGAQGDVSANSDEEWHRVWDINVVGMARMARAALPHLRRSDGASITNTASVAATVGLPDRVLYSATKGAVLSMTRAMAADHIWEGIRVNCVAPGTADTPWIARLLDQADDPAAERAALAARQPHGRLVSPDEVAQAIAYLADPANRSAIGLCLTVDGGMESLRLRAE